MRVTHCHVLMHHKYGFSLIVYKSDPQHSWIQWFEENPDVKDAVSATIRKYKQYGLSGSSKEKPDPSI